MMKAAKRRDWKARGFEKEPKMVAISGAECVDILEYDFDNDGTVENSEKQPVHFNRLVR